MRIVEDRLLGTQKARYVFNVCRCLRHVARVLGFGIFLIVPRLHHNAAPPKFTSSNNNSLSCRNLVGASGFEPEASCAQGRRATRLRYAPTVSALQFRYDSKILPQTRLPQTGKQSLHVLGGVWSAKSDCLLR
jgi:hypothetical protein